eukprot:scaffold256933_cov28-Tisochrysis_lutea.AAC.2
MARSAAGEEQRLRVHCAVAAFVLSRALGCVSRAVLSPVTGSMPLRVGNTPCDGSTVQALPRLLLSL